MEPRNRLLWMLIYKYSYHILYSISRITQDNRSPFSQQYYSSTTEFPSPNNIIALCGKAEKQECKAQGQKLTDPPDLMEWTALDEAYSTTYNTRLKGVHWTLVSFALIYSNTRSYYLMCML
jgi:hypothetical protein